MVKFAQKHTFMPELNRKIIFAKKLNPLCIVHILPSLSFLGDIFEKKYIPSQPLPSFLNHIPKNKIPIILGGTQKLVNF